MSRTATPLHPAPQPLTAGMRVWRISAWPGLQGIGGMHCDGRWHTRPRHVLYAAEHPALAALEVMAHMRLALADIPLTLQLIGIDIAASALCAAPLKLPSGWQANQASTQALGNRWLDSHAALLLPVPSAVLPHASNFIINANHPQASTHLHEAVIEPFWFDQRHLR